MASFVLSPSGQTYGRVCEAWGVDPGAAFDDDVLGYNLQLGLLLGRPATDKPAEVEDAHVVTDLDRQMKAMQRGE